MSIVRRILGAGLGVLLLAAAACGGSGSTPADAAAPIAPPPPPAIDPIPSPGFELLDVASWNMDWFGSTGFGPVDEPLQLANARAIIGAADAEIWGLQEVVDEAQFAALKAGLPGYEGFLSNDPAVVDGAAYYSDFNNAEQKVGLLYKASVATVLDARLILTDHDYDCAGRPPMQVTLAVTLNGRTETRIIIVMHAKSGADAASYLRRTAASAALKAYLDYGSAGRKVLVIGDFNDALDASVCGGNVTPYANFLADGRYSFATLPLTLAHLSTITTTNLALDHHLALNETAQAVTIFPAGGLVADYATTTSDHYPVISRYAQHD